MITLRHDLPAGGKLPGEGHIEHRPIATHLTPPRGDVWHMLDNPGRCLGDIEAMVREQGHKTPQGPQYTGRLPDRPYGIGYVLKRHTRDDEVELALSKRLQARGIGHVIVDAELLLRLALPCSNDDRSRGIHARDLGPQPRQLAGERAITAAHTEHSSSR